MATSVRMGVFLLICSLIIASLFPFHITYAAAPLVMLMYSAHLSTVLWLSICSGLFMDVVELTPHFGLLGLTYLLSARFLYPFRLYFFKDSAITLPVMTCIFSLFTTHLAPLIALFFDVPQPSMYPHDIFLQPIVDVFFAVSIFMLPSFIITQYRLKIRKRRYNDDS